MQVRCTVCQLVHDLDKGHICRNRHIYYRHIRVYEFVVDTIIKKVGKDNWWNRFYKHNEYKIACSLLSWIWP
jgi:hypothetical protein